VQSFVRQHGGHLVVRSEPGNGATFELHLPDTPEAARTFSTAQPLPPPTGGRERVLLLEPDAVLNKMVGGILATDGYRVDTVETPDAVPGILVRPEAKPDLLIFDCGPQDAARLARALREAGPGPKVLCVSTVMPADFADLAAGSVAHLPKPFALSALLRAARNLLDGNNGG
jgi:DNA-binding response OmpR family regulator